jgi:hypothetical protein
MRLEQDYSAAVVGSQMVLPLFQPLRLWSPRPEKVPVRCDVAPKKTDSSSAAFTMKGGFVSVDGGERRLMIAGKIFRAVAN